MAVCVIFPDDVAMEGLAPGGHLHATAVVILCLYHDSRMLLCSTKTLYLPKVCFFMYGEWGTCFPVGIYLFFEIT